MKEWLKTVFTIIGSVVGAGFLSGRELLRFFGGKAYFPHVLLCGGIFFVYLLFLLRVGGRFGGFDGVMECVFGKNTPLQKVVKGVFLVCSFVIVSAMLSGIDALAPSFAPYISLLTALACFFLVKKGISGVGVLNLVLVPVMLVYLGAQLFTKGEFTFFDESEQSGMWIWAYVAMNLFLASSVVTDCGKVLQNINKMITVAFVSAMIICFFVSMILSAICASEEAKGHTMPVFYLLQDGKLFVLMSYFGIVTTLIASYYPLHLWVEKLTEKLPKIMNKGKGAVEAGVLLAASLCARSGLEKIVEYAYPMIGLVGMIFLTVVIFHDEFFEQSYQKIHNAREKTKNKRCRHYKV